MIIWKPIYIITITIPHWMPRLFHLPRNMSASYSGPCNEARPFQQGWDEALQSLFRNLPKADLHVHLDGSLFPSFIQARAIALNSPLPTSPDLLRAHLVSSKKDAPHQEPGGNWNAFDFCNKFLQSATELAEATRQLMDFMVLEHRVRVLEIRFCPALHTLGGLSEDAAVRAVAETFLRYFASASKPLRGGVILCALRSKGPAHARETFELAKRWLGRGVIGADVAGDEARFPLQEFDSPLRAAVADGVPLTIHAGEWVAGAAGNVKLAVEVGAKRLGHALVLGEDAGLRKLVREHGVFVETCISSNCAHPDRVADGAYENHPVREMLCDGVKAAGFNCDNVMLSGTPAEQPDPTAEIARAVLRCGLTLGQVREVLVNGARASFAVGESEEDQEFIRQFEQDVDEEISKFTLLHGDVRKEEKNRRLNTLYN